MQNSSFWLAIAAMVVLIVFIGRRGGNIFRLWPIAIVVVGAALYQYSLDRTIKKGDDFPVYYAAGQGVMLPKGNHAWYIQSPRLLPTFGWMRGLTYEQAFTVSYVVSVVAFYMLMRKLFRRYSQYPCTVICTAALSGVVWIDVLRMQNMGGLLALAVTTPVGAVLAMCYKPYLGVFVVLHAANYATRLSASPAVLEDELPVRGGRGGRLL